MSARPSRRGAGSARRAFKVYAFNDGRSIWRHVQPVHVDASGQTLAYPNGPHIRDPKSFSMYARFDVFEPYVKIGNQLQPRWIDSVIYTEERNVQTLRSTNAPHRPTDPVDEAHALLISFFRDAGIHPWIGGSLPYAIEVDDHLQPALDRVGASVSALDVLQGEDRSEQACRKRMEEAIDKLEQEMSSMEGFTTVKSHDTWDDDVPFVEMSRTQEGMGIEIKTKRYIYNDADQDRDRWSVSVTMDGFAKVGLSRDNLVQALSDAVVGLKSLRLVTFSEAEAFWATYDRPGDFTFDASTFRLLDVRNPVFLHDDDFVTWAVAAGLEEANFTEYP